MDSVTAAAALARLADLATATQEQVDLLLTIAHRYRETLRQGGTLYFAGNGGSAADAQHIAAEYVVKRSGRPGFAAVALTTDTSLLTAAGNDLGFEQVFACQVESVLRERDLLILHSTSGESANLLAAARAARQKGIGVISFLGCGGGRLAALSDLAFIVPSDETARIQEIHLAVEHIIVSLLEEEE